MKDMIQKLRQASGPLALGWLMTIWMPVPGQVRMAVSTTVDAVRNGVHAMVDTVTADPNQQHRQKTAKN